MSEGGRGLEERIARKLLEVFSGFFASRRDGLVLVKLNVNDRTVLVWVRSSPITENALQLYDKFASKHRFDEAWLLKVRDVADYVSFRDLRERFARILRSMDELKRLG